MTLLLWLALNASPPPLRPVNPEDIDTANHRTSRERLPGALSSISFRFRDKTRAGCRLKVTPNYSGWTEAPPPTFTNLPNLCHAGDKQLAANQTASTVTHQLGMTAHPGGQISVGSRRALCCLLGADLGQQSPVGVGLGVQVCGRLGKVSKSSSDWIFSGQDSVGDWQEPHQMSTDMRSACSSWSLRTSASDPLMSLRTEMVFPGL